VQGSSEELSAIRHIGWYREQERQSDLVSMSLWWGSLLACLPLAIATWIDRSDGQFRLINELGFLTVSVLLLGSGAVLQLKATTLVGSTMTAFYFLTMLLFLRDLFARLSTVATAILIGGSLIFGTGLVLAFFRDRLLALPEQIKQREGLFRVINWR